MTGSTFVSDQKAEERYIGLSLNVMVANTSKGVSPKVAADLNAMAKDPRNTASKSKIDAFAEYSSKIMQPKTYTFTAETGIAASQVVSAAGTVEAAQPAVTAHTAAKNNFKA